MPAHRLASVCWRLQSCEAAVPTDGCVALRISEACRWRVAQRCGGAGGVIMCILMSLRGPVCVMMCVFRHKRLLHSMGVCSCLRLPGCGLVAVWCACSNRGDDWRAWYLTLAAH